jgi:hypothetical protein
MLIEEHQTNRHAISAQQLKRNMSGNIGESRFDFLLVEQDVLPHNGVVPTGHVQNEDEASRCTKGAAEVAF